MSMLSPAVPSFPVLLEKIFCRGKEIFLPISREVPEASWTKLVPGDFEFCIELSFPECL